MFYHSVLRPCATCLLYFVRVVDILLGDRTMPDSKRLPLSAQDEAVLRDRQIDALLDEGLDRYFSARYEDAIHLWTRVLFLDRSHARARAYIERARTALAEMQRRSDELLQASRDLLEQGETEAARQLFSEAVAASADELQSAALRVRLERWERVRRAGTPVEESPAVDEQVSPWTWAQRPGRAVGAGLAVLVILGLAGIFVQGGSNPQDLRDAATPTEAGLAGGPAAPITTKLTVLSSSQVALVRARTSFAHGRLSQALRDLDRIEIDSVDRAAADALRIEIQQLLMASARSTSATTLTEPIRR